MHDTNPYTAGVLPAPPLITREPIYIGGETHMQTAEGKKHV